MTERNLGLEILEGIREVKKHKQGDIALTTKQFTEPSSSRIIRQKLHLSQSAFAGLMGVSIRTIQDWEQGRRTPKGPAKSLLCIAEQYPEVLAKIQ
jgi:putative transcriptional regulator